MRCLKTLGLAAVVAAALMAFIGASSASATVLCKTVPAGTPTGTTCPPSWAMSAGGVIHARTAINAHITWTSNESFKPNITCEEMTVEAEVLNEGSATETVKAAIKTFIFGQCGESEVRVINKGTLEIHWISNTHNGTVTGTGQEITTVTPSIFGNIHCIYRTNATDWGELTGSKVANETAVWHAENQPFPLLSTSSLCPSKPTVDATYTIETPDTLTVASHT